MNRSDLLLVVLLLLAGAGCRAPVVAGRPSWERLPEGKWVEAEGRIVDGRPRATEIDEKEATKADRPERYEILGAVEAHDKAGKSVHLLDHALTITGETRFEDASKNEIDPFELTRGSWIKVKATRDGSGECRARVIRRATPGKRFEVEGVVLEVRADPPAVRIGGIWLDLEAGTDVGVLEKKKERAQEILEGPKSPLTLFQEDEQKGARFTFQPRDDLYVGGQLYLAGRGRDEYDLNRDNDRDDTRIQEQVKGNLLWGLADNGSFALFEVAALREDEFKDDRENERDDLFLITRAYGYWILDDTMRLQVGRQDYDEEREWLYDDRMDGVRFHYRGTPIELEVSLSTGLKVLNRKNQREDTLTMISLARYRLDADHHLSAYVIDRRDRGDVDFSPRHYGLRSFGRPKTGLRHWVEFSRATGDDRLRQIDGYGMDAGLTYAVDHDLKPAFTVGWALGTGDRDPNDDRAPFRQTGLQDNNAKFGGITSFRYYGELFDPELSNLEIATIGAGIRPVKNASIDLIAHTYRQDWMSNERSRTDLKRAANGLSRNIGWELDMVFGYRWEKTVTMELVLARFDPGRAFDERDPAYMATLQLRYRF